MPHTPGIYKYIHQPVQFTLVVDDFGVKYVGTDNADHLLNVLKKQISN